jgi:hypothetical protein
VSGAKLRVGLLIAAAMLALPQSVLAQGSMFTGNLRYDGCKNYQATTNRTLFDQGLCVGIVSTLFYVSKSLPSDARFCVPEDANLGQAIRIAIAYMDANPGKQHKDFRELVITALRNAWPCED